METEVAVGKKEIGTYTILANRLLMSSLKERKEAFVSGLEGGSILEINVVTSIALTSYLCANLISYNDTQNIPLGIDFVLNWVAMLLSFTLYSQDIYLLTTLCLIPSIGWFLLNYKRNLKQSKNTVKHTTKEAVQKFELTKKPFLTAYRSGMLILTCLAILAVDFQIFPRRFAKVETWGTSLMDLGVGSFVFSNGIVSSRGLFREKMKDKKDKASSIKKIFAATRSGTTLLILGLSRLFFVKNLEYQEHVTEYGVHWNFFITLSLLPPVLVLIDPITSYIPQCILAMLFSTVYQLFLIKDDSLLTYLVLSDRNTFINANREGLISFVGYCSIFLWGQTIGFFILGNKKTTNNLYKCSVTVSRDKKNRTLWDRLTTVGPSLGLLIWFIITYALSEGLYLIHPQTVSRRFANMPYVLWVVCYNTAFLLCYSLVDKLFGNSSNFYRISTLLEAMNCNGLAMFLISNVSTGLVNMCIPTIDQNDKVSIVILLIYAAFLAMVSFSLYKHKIFIKL